MGGTSLTVTPTLVADQVYEALQQAVFTGELAAGTPLRVRDLAAMVGTSVMPVREAVRRLEEAGLATRVPHKGAVVREFTVRELIDIYDVRTMLEVEAARRGAEKITRDGIRTMETGCAKMLRSVAEGRLIDALDEDETILRALYEAGGSPVLMSLIDTLWTQCRPYKFIGAAEARENDDASLWTHQPRLVAVARAHDVERAVAVTDESLASARRRLETRLLGSTNIPSHDEQTRSTS